MADRTRSLILIGLLSAAAVCTTACRDTARSSTPDRSEPSRGNRSASTQPTTLTGKLSSGAVAVGGETTGWRLIGDGQTGGIDVDVSKVKARAKFLDGQRVTVTGRMTSRSWPERGDTPLMVAESIEPAPAPKQR